MECMDGSESEDDSSNHSLDISIRRARISDVDGIVSVYSSSIDYLDVESRDWIESIVRRRSRRARIYVAIGDGSVLGFIVVYKKRSRAYIDAFAVDPRYRGRGIGQHLLNYVEKVLATEGVERVYLTVKNHNSRALGIYIRNGYRISNIVLILEASSGDIDSSMDRLDSVAVKIDSIKRSVFPKVRLLDTAIWSNYTWDVDDAIYRASTEEAIAITVYRGRRLVGVARISINQNRIVVERLALSFYKPTESLKMAINAIKMRLVQQSDKIIAIPVDSTKSSLLRTLISMGFKVVDSEYVLYKDLLENIDNEIQQEQEMVAVHR